MAHPYDSKMTFPTFAIDVLGVDDMFMKKYYALFNPDNYENNNKFVIYAHVLDLWLDDSDSYENGHSENQNIEGMIKTLRTSYIENTDFYVNKTESPQGQLKNVYMLTIVCAKMITMSSNRPMNKDVELYFIELENALDKYKEYIIKCLNDRIAVLESNQKQRMNTNEDVIYIAELPGSEMIMIGKTNNEDRRMGEHSSSSPDTLRVTHSHKTKHKDAVETCLKIGLKSNQCRKKKEIYKTSSDKAMHILQHCEYICSFLSDKQMSEEDVKKMHEADEFYLRFKKETIDITDEFNYDKVYSDTSSFDDKTKLKLKQIKKNKKRTRSLVTSETSPFNYDS